MIKLIDINKIHHHPDNPRKELGDLSELAESIKQSGVLQNLTLVPIEGKEDEFYAVIGNRRLAAAKLAGLKEIPAAIIEMDHKTQVGTMLLENMQRVDLTVYEQAQGFQMMLNLGETIANISEKTGFSDTTVRRRVKLLELDQDKFKESAERGVTLMDYVELEKIEDIKLRNKVLEKIGTVDFKYTMQKAIDDEKREKSISKIIEQLDIFATRVEERGNLRHIRSFNPHDDIVETPNDADIVEYFYEVGHWIYLYKENNQLEEDVEKEKERIEREKKESRKAEIREISDRAYNLRLDFIKNLSNTKAKKNIETIIEANIYANSGYRSSLDYEELAEIMGIEINDEDIEWKVIEAHIWKQPELYLLLATYNILDDEEKYLDWQCRYRSNEDLDYIYKFLEKLGYKISEEEQDMKDGTHELFEVEG